MCSSPNREGYREREEERGRERDEERGRGEGGGEWERSGERGRGEEREEERGKGEGGEERERRGRRREEQEREGDIGRGELLVIYVARALNVVNCYYVKASSVSYCSACQEIASFLVVVKWGHSKPFSAIGSSA